MLLGGRQVRELHGFFGNLASSLILGLFAIVVGTTAPANAQEAIVERGKEIFEAYCAVCHGNDGRGEGELGKLLRTAPPDLTKITENAEGRFPVVGTFNVIVGGLAIPAHGGEGMPVWGQFFLEEALNETGISELYAADIAAGRVLSLVYFLETIQE